MRRLFVAFLFFSSVCAISEKSLVIVIPSYNNAKYYQKNLDSVFSQNYENYRVIYINDASIDKTGELVEAYVQEKGFADRVTIIHNPKNMRALHNIYYAVHSCADDEVILTLDGDDWFSDDQVLAFVNEQYQDPDVWLTYGQFERYPGGRSGICKQIPPDIIARNKFRDYSWVTSQLRTFYAKLFKSIALDDLLHEGKFFPAAYDVAMMFPMLEMAGKHIRFISRVLYVYNQTNPINDNKVHRKEQALGRGMRYMKRYRPLEKLFED